MIRATSLVINMELEAKLQKKDEVIAEIAEENMLLKKTFGGRS